MGLNHTSYIRYLKDANYYIGIHTQQRLGQAYYNSFRIIYPYLEDEIIHTEFDCFNDDSKLPAFLTWVQARLDRLDSSK